MINWAHELGIDLEKLKAEGFTRWERRKPDKPRIELPHEATEFWQPLARAANRIGYNVETLRRWSDKGYIQTVKHKGRTWVYYPDVIRHAHKA